MFVQVKFCFYEPALLMVLIITAILIIWIFRQKLKINYQNNLVPTVPINLPLIGYLPFLGKKPHIKLVQLGKKYGNVFSIKMGSMNVVVLNDYAAIKEAFNKDEFLGRPQNVAFNVVLEIQGLGTLSGDSWKQQKRFTMHQLRDLGFGKITMEQHIQCEAKELIERIEKQEDKPIKIRSWLTTTTSSNISALVFGKRFDYRDSKRIQIDKAIERAIKKLGQTGIITFFPCFAKLCAKLGFFGLRKLKHDFLIVNNYINNEIKEHEKTLDANNIRDYIDSFLLKMRNIKNNESTFTKKMLAGNVQGFFAAGSETVKTTMEWALLIMAKFPDIQKKVQDEIDCVCGKSTPSWADRVNLPYTQAVINEIHRWKTISPLNLLRQTLCDTTVQGLFVPSGTNVIANLWSVHHDPFYWKSPELFDPNRFLNNGQLIKYEMFIPFSIGKRSCPGETFAQIEVFLGFVSLLQKFSISSFANIELEEEIGLITQPKQEAVLKFTKRSFNFDGTK